jgi:hypothetical protein
MTLLLEYAWPFTLDDNSPHERHLVEPGPATGAPFDIILFAETMVIELQPMSCPNNRRCLLKPS